MELVLHEYILSISALPPLLLNSDRQWEEKTAGKPSGDSIMNKIFSFLVNNMRRGFATNSSSSHSLVYYKTNKSDKQPKGKKIDGTRMNNEYGWNFFKLNTTAEKLFYALVQAVGNGGWPNPVTSKADLEKVNEMYEKYGKAFPEFGKQDFMHAYNGNVDHESRVGFSQKLIDAARDPKAVIYGGDDNSSESIEDMADDPGDIKSYSYISDL